MNRITASPSPIIRSAQTAQPQSTNSIAEMISNRWLSPAEESRIRNTIDFVLSPYLADPLGERLNPAADRLIQHFVDTVRRFAQTGQLSGLQKSELRLCLEQIVDYTLPQQNADFRKHYTNQLISAFSLQPLSNEVSYK